MELDNPIICRKECDLSPTNNLSLTNNPDRGCIKVTLQLRIFSSTFPQLGVHLEGIPEVASCPSIQGTRVDYLRQELDKVASDLAEAYEARRFTTDSCTAITWYTACR